MFLGHLRDNFVFKFLWNIPEGPGVVIYVQHDPRYEAVPVTVPPLPLLRALKQDEGVPAGVEPSQQAFTECLLGL